MEDLISEWYVAKQQLDALKEREITLRKRLVERIFPQAGEGTHTHDLGEGYALKVSVPYTRTIDEPALQNLREDLILAQVPLHNLIKFKPSLILKEYRALTQGQLQAFDQVITTKPGSPSVSIKQVKL